jgi:hypothetical protein
MMNLKNILKRRLTITLKMKEMAWQIQIKRHHWRVIAKKF